MALLLLGACSVEQQADAGRDAGDAGRDAGRDAATPPDAGRDAGPDAGVAPVVWEQVEGLPEICRIEVARDPDRALPPFGFEPCPEPEGCRQFVADFPEHPRGIRFQVRAPVHVDAEQILIPYYRPMIVDRNRDLNYHAVVSHTGEHLAVVRSPPLTTGEEHCAVTFIAPAAQSYVFVVAYRTGPPASIPETYVLRAPYTAPSQVEPLWEGDGPTTGRFVQLIEASDTAVGMFTTPPLEVLRIGRTGGATAVCAAEPGAPFCIIDEVVGDAVLSSYDQGGWWIAIAGPEDERSRPLIDLPDSDDTNARSDGTDLVWLRGFGPIVAGRPSRIELWASPYAESRERIAPQRIGRINVMGLVNSIGVGNGRAWALELIDLSDSGAYYASIYELGSGERRVYRAAADERAGEPMLGREQLAVAIHPAPPGNVRETRTVRFIPYDALPVEPPRE